MSSVVIRPERPGDEAAIRRLHDAAFGGPVESGIVDALRGTDRWIEGGSLVAVDEGDDADDGAVGGHLLLSEGDLDLDAGGARRIWMVGPVGVRPDRQRQGIGAALMHAAIELATSRGQPVLCLLGHASYYPRFGFEPAAAIGVRAPRAWPERSWLALRLPAWDPSIRGLAHFAAAFPDAT